MHILELFKIRLKEKQRHLSHTKKAMIWHICLVSMQVHHRIKDGYGAPNCKNYKSMNTPCKSQDI